MDRRNQAQCKNCGVIYTFSCDKLPKAAVCTCDSTQFKTVKE